MAASRPLERRTALWPYLVMPLVVLLVFFALRSIHQQRTEAGSVPAGTAADTLPASR